MFQLCSIWASRFIRVQGILPSRSFSAFKSLTPISSHLHSAASLPPHRHYSKDLIQDIEFRPTSDQNLVNIDARQIGSDLPTVRSDVIEISVDVSNLPTRRPAVSHDLHLNKEPETPLVSHLRKVIQIRGPIPMGTFMREALTHPKHGYYMKQDVFGARGDFTTAPEISQMFGELVGIWAVATWQQLNCPPAFNLVELGPGRGTLMADMLRAARVSPAFLKALNVHMIEVSPHMKGMQQAALGVTDGRTAAGIPVHWYSSIAAVPAKPTIFIAQELFDALPVSQFQYMDRGWRERLVDVDDSPDNPRHFRFVLAKGPTPALAMLRRSFDTGKPSFGDQIEISVEGMALAEELTRRIDQEGGAALLIDYGQAGAVPHSIRGIRAHQAAHPLSLPGDVDLSISVDFSALARTAEAGSAGRVKATGPVEQAVFLHLMGIEVRLEALAAAHPEKQEELEAAYERLTSPEQMGRSYQALALAPAGLAPLGFPYQGAQAIKLLSFLRLIEQGPPDQEAGDNSA